MATQWVETYGEWAVITGASDGIGKAIVYELAAKGLNLVLVARRQHILQALADDLRQRFPVETHIIDADLATADGVERVITETQEVNVGLLVAAAGFGTAGTFIDMPLDRELNMLDVNCGAVLALSHHFGNRFVEQRRGGLILFSSLMAFQGAPLMANYAATKAYIQALAEGLRHELAPYGVDVLASAPGPINSGFAARADMRMNMAMTPEIVARDTLNALGRRANVRPGFSSKFLIGSLHTLPRQMRVWAMKQITRDMTKHQDQSVAESASQSV